MLEALFAILIFPLGVLALIALQANAIVVQSDAQYRIEAANMADQILGQINLNVSRDTGTGNVTAASLNAFSHQPSGGTSECKTNGADCCNFSGTASSNAFVTSWVTAITTTAATRLPGATTAMQQIAISTGNSNRATVVICWRGPNDPTPRFHRVIAYVN